MLDRVLPVLPFACAFVGAAWLALSMAVHWEQVHGTPAPGRLAAIVLRGLGVVALLASLVVGLSVDHASMAVLVWVMTLAGSSFLVAQLLAWRPRWLRWLAPIARRPRA